MARVGAMEADRQLVTYDANQRRVTRTRRRLMTVAITLIAFAGFGGVVYYFYAQNRDAAMAGLVPIIRAVEGPTKVKPEAPGGMEVPNRGLGVYDLIDRNPAPAPGGRVERLLPPPEQPVAVPPPAPPPVAVAPPPPAAAPPAMAPSAAAPPAATAPPAAATPPAAAVPPPEAAEPDAYAEQAPVVVTGKDIPPQPKVRPPRPLPRAVSATAPQAGEPPAAAPPPIAAPAPAPPPAVAQAPPPVVATRPVEPPAAERPRPSPPATVAASRGARVQLLAGRTEDSVRLEWARLQRENPELLGRLRAEIVRIDLDGGRGSFYRVYAMPNGDAERLCNEVRQRRVECFVVGP